MLESRYWGHVSLSEVDSLVTQEFCTFLQKALGSIPTSAALFLMSGRSQGGHDLIPDFFSTIDFCILILTVSYLECQVIGIDKTSRVCYH